MPTVTVRTRDPLNMTRPSGSGAVAWTFVVAPIRPVSGRLTPHEYRHVVETACAALAPNDSYTTVAPSSMVRTGCGVCVAPWTSATETARISHHLPAGTVSAISAFAAGLVPTTTRRTARLG